jgi:zinc finger BED domain-containing protein 1 (E3 SUMO-protein ligase ZBED1)
MDLSIGNEPGSSIVNQATGIHEMTPILKLNPLKRRQLAITNFTPKKISVDGQKKLDNSLMKLFIKDLQPFSVVEDTGFKEFVNMLNPGYKIPNRHSISKTLIPAAYEKCVNEVKETISNELVTACLTTDCWTSRDNKSYIAITVHFIDNNFNLKSILLSCHSLIENHTSENLAEQINKTLNAWNLKNKIVFSVSDNAYNIQNALAQLKFKHFGCFAHTLNLIVQCALKKENDLIDKVKNICTHFRKSTNANNKLIAYQKNIGIDNPLKVLQDVATRWNATFYMLERFVQLETSIRGTMGLLDNAPPCLNSDEWTAIKEFCNILRPFEEATRAVSGDQYMTASLVIVIAQGLKNVCEQMKNENYSLRTLGLVNNLLNGMRDRQSWGNIENSKTLKICTFLDPRFKIIPFNHNENMINSVE